MPFVVPCWGRDPVDYCNRWLWSRRSPGRRVYGGSPGQAGDDDLNLVCCVKIEATVATQLIPVIRRLNKTPVPGRADQDFVDADPRRHAGDEGDGAAGLRTFVTDQLFKARDKKFRASSSRP